MKTVTTESNRYILKIGSCLSVSGKSTLTYHFSGGEDKQLYLRIVANTAAGFFSQEWLPLSLIDQVLSKAGSHFTSFALQPLFRSKSQNNPAFLLAVLLNEGIVGRSAEKKRQYQPLSSGPLVAELKALIDSKTALNVDDQPAGDKPVKSTQNKAKADKASHPKAGPDATGS